MKFSPGTSGNPAGRAPGSKNRVTILRESLNGAIPQILETLTQQAIAGDVSSARLLLERVVPPVRATGPSLESELEGFVNGDLATRAELVVAAMGRGDVSVDMAQAMLAALNTQASIAESSDLAARIEKLEEVLLNGRSNT